MRLKNVNSNLCKVLSQSSRFTTIFVQNEKIKLKFLRPLLTLDFDKICFRLRYSGATTALSLGSNSFWISSVRNFCSILTSNKNSRSIRSTLDATVQVGRKYHCIRKLFTVNKSARIVIMMILYMMITLSNCYLVWTDQAVLETLFWFQVSEDGGQNKSTVILGKLKIAWAVPTSIHFSNYFLQRRCCCLSSHAPCYW